MKAIMIFNRLNDLLFGKWDNSFLQHLKYVKRQNNEEIRDTHNVSQLLSPVIASQRVMAAQFGNTYTSMNCRDKWTVVYDEWLDHIFMLVSQDSVDDSQRELLDCKTFVQHICGQNLNLLQSPVYHEWLSVLLDCRTKGDSIPGASGIIGESGATSAAINALKTISKEIKYSAYQHYHLMLYVGDKLLALYSSRGSDDLTAPDLILMSTQCIAAQEHWKSIESVESREPEFSRLPWLSEENSAIVNICAGSTASPCAPHSMHLAEVAPRITFAVLFDMDMRDVGMNSQISSQVLINLRKLLLQRNLELLPATLDSLETSLKKTSDALRKIRSSSSLYGPLASRMAELRKSCTTTTPLTPETAATAMHTALDAVIEYLKPDIPSVNILQPTKELRSIIAPYVEFLRVKAMRFFSLDSGETDASSYITAHKYVEEFPGLVHFVYVDRTTGRFLAPDMVDCADTLSTDTYRSMISRSLSVTREGYCAATWRRGSLHVCSVLWWEKRGVAIKPTCVPHPAAVRALPSPGDILGNFYRQLAELTFPNDTQGVKVKEIICIHLGLVPSSTAVLQARQLAHTVHELAGDNHAVTADLI